MVVLSSFAMAKRNSRTMHRNVLVGKFQVLAYTTGPIRASQGTIGLGSKAVHRASQAKEGKLSISLYPSSHHPHTATRERFVLCKIGNFETNMTSLHFVLREEC